MPGARRFVYIIRSRSDTNRYYTGLTSDVDRVWLPTTPDTARTPRQDDRGKLRAAGARSATNEVRAHFQEQC